MSIRLLTLCLTGFAWAPCFADERLSSSPDDEQRQVLRVLTAYSPVALEAAASIHEFEEAFGCWVEWSFLHQFELSRMVFESEEIYDVVSVDEPWIPKLSDALLPVSEWKDRPSAAFHLSETARSLAEWEGREYGAVILPNLYVYAFRADLLFDLESNGGGDRSAVPPVSRDELFRVSSLLSRDGEYQGFAPYTKLSEAMLVDLMWCLKTEGVDLADVSAWARWGESDLARGLLSFREFHSLAGKGNSLESGDFVEEVNGSYIRGNVAHIFQWADHTGALLNPLYSRAGATTGFGFLPGGEGQAAFAITGFWYLGIPKVADHPELASEFIGWWTGRQESWAPESMEALYSKAEGRTWSRPRLKEYPKFSEEMMGVIA
ncbi:MAG: hypothetical protein AAGB46_16645, partial [Verrucomicrobiota bacterium]